MTQHRQIFTTLLVVVAIVTLFVALFAAYIDLFTQGRVETSPAKEATSVDDDQSVKNMSKNRDSAISSHTVRNMTAPHRHHMRLDMEPLPADLQDYLDERSKAVMQVIPTATGYRVRANGQWEVVSIAVVGPDGELMIIEQQIQPRRPLDLPAPSS